MELFSLEGKTVAITGASSGFGHHFAGVLANAGASLILGARRLDRIQDRVRDINGSGSAALGVALDVRDPDSCESFLSTAQKE